MNLFIKNLIVVMVVSLVLIVLACGSNSSKKNNSANANSELPGDPSLVSTETELKQLAEFEKGTYKYSVEDFMRSSAISKIQYSPNGNYLSYKKREDDGKVNVYIKNIETGIEKKVIEEKKQLIGKYMWLGDSRMGYLMDKGGDENHHLYSINVDGSDDTDLTPYECVKVEFLKQVGDFIIVMMNKTSPAVFNLYKINFKTLDTSLVYAVDMKDGFAAEYFIDQDGNLQGYKKYEPDGYHYSIYFKSSKTSKMEKIASWKMTEVEFYFKDFNLATKNPYDAYVYNNVNSDKIVLQLYDFNKKKFIKTIYSNPSFDAKDFLGINDDGDFRVSKKRGYELDYVFYNSDQGKEVVPFSKYYKSLHKRLSRDLASYDFTIADASKNEDKFLIFAESDRLRGKYYQYDTTTDKLKELYNLAPQLKEEDMLPMKPITFKSRDGLAIHGYITLPNNIPSGKKIPMIVNPHGGPMGIRDFKKFNPEVQLFSSRGYAVLQVNFRISGGYGRKFLQAGSKQIGRKTIDDIEDGVHYSLVTEPIDKHKIAIYGGSHGGYATLMSLIKTPDLYSAGIDYVGVSSIETFRKNIPELWKILKGPLHSIWYDLDDPKELEIARSVSPLLHTDKIKKPLLVIQGANDPRVNIEESDQIVKALRKKGFETPYLVKYNEGHGFYREENRIEVYKVMLGFLAKHLK